MAMQFQPVPPPKDDTRKTSKLVTPDEAHRLERSRDWLSEQTKIGRHYWSDEAVRQMQQITPAPLLWKNVVVVARKS